MKMIFAVSALTASLVTTGCNSFKLSENSSQLVNIQKRTVLVGGAETTVITKDAGTTTTVTNIKVCAEPSPDAMSAMAMEAAAKGGVPSKVQVELSGALQQSAAFVGLRTTSIQLLRDFGYRLCEAYLSGAIDKGQYDLLMRRFQKNVVALLAIEQLTGAVKAPPVILTTQGQAETTQSLSEQRDIREKVSKKIADLEKEKKEIEDKKAALIKANANADTKDLDAQITAKGEEIKRYKEDLEAIDKSIASVKGTLVQGRTAGVVHSENSSVTRSDEVMKAVASVVGDITMAIVKSDDIVQMCLTILRDSIGSQDETRKNFAAWCQKELDLDQAGRRIYLTALSKEITTKEKIAADNTSTTEQKQKAEKDLIDLKKQLGNAWKELGTYRIEKTE